MCLIFQQKITGFKEELTNTKVHEFIVKSITDIQGNHGRISKTRPIYHLTEVLRWNLSLVTKASKTARRLAKTTVLTTNVFSSKNQLYDIPWNQQTKG